MSSFCLVLGVLAAACGAPAQQRPSPRPAMHQSQAARPEPDGSRPVFINPPTFRWPAGSGPYTLQFARRADFSGATTAKVDNESFYRPLQPMEPGRWHWRVRGKDGEWNTAGFDLPADAARWPVAAWDRALDRVPKQHPRLWVRPEQVASLRAKAAGPLKDYMDSWSAAAKRFIGAPLPLESDKARHNDNEHKARSKQRVAAKEDAIRTMRPAGDLAFLYLATGNEDFAHEAKRRALAAARLDPDGYTSRSVSDFADSTIIVNAARVYDYLYPILTSEEKSTLRAMLSARLKRTFSAYRPGLEKALYGAHAWQEALLEATAGALALFGEAPEAREWLDWSLRLHVAAYPWFGGRDGGSAEGVNYYSCCNMIQSLTARDFFFAAAGIDLAGNPWFRGTSRYLIYGYPAGGSRSRFGDNNSSGAPPGPPHKLAALRQAALFDDPYAAAYAAVIPGGLPAGSWEAVLWSPFDKLPQKPLSGLPPAQAFFDIGVVFMHSALADPARNVSFEFKSSPYGSFNHAHADQNSFNVAIAGEPLVVDSGYYAAFGDEHHRQYTVQTIAHNAILVDGKGQAAGNLGAYGEIKRFERGDGFAYALGSAPNAYPHVALSRADRHVLWLAPATYIVVDDLGAADGLPHRYDWLLHAAREMRIDEGRRMALLSNAKGRARLTLLSPRELRMRQTHGFEPAPKNWLRPGQREFPDQWHLTVQPGTASPRQRFIAVLQVLTGDGGEYEPLPALAKDPRLRRAWAEWLPVAGTRPEEIFQ